MSWNIEQENLDDLHKLKSTVRMTEDDRDAVNKIFGGVQRAFDRVILEAHQETGWLPDLPKRLIPAYKAIRDIAQQDTNHNARSDVLREAIICACDCTRKTAVRYLHDLKLRRLIHSFEPIGDEYVHFIACTDEDMKKIIEIRRRKAQ